MIRKFVTFAAVCAMLAAGLLGLTTRTTVSSAPKPQRRFDEKAFRANGLIVKPRKGANERALRGLHGSNGVVVSAEFPDLGNIQVLELPENLPVDKALEIYSHNPEIEYAEPDYLVSIGQEIKEESEITGGGGSIESDVSITAATTPSDLNTNLWGMNNTGQTGGTPDADIDAPEAWGLSTDASSVIVGVVDTGIEYTHPDLAANMWTNPREIAGNGIDDDSNGYIDDVYGINALTNSGDPKDDHYHGTHVSGTIGAVGNNGIGVVGVAWNVKLMGLKFLNSSGSGSTSDAIKCINYGRLMGAKVLSNSWGGGGFSQALYDAISAANQAGIVFVAAAGNSSADNDSGGFYPANYALPNVIAVASTDARDAKSSFSNYGYKTVAVAAPGSSIYSTYPNASYSSLSGTSMATPHVSGAIALLKAYRPELGSPQPLIQRIVQSTDPISSLSNVTFSGGRLNVYNALAGLVRPIPHLVVSAKTGEPGGTFTFTDDSQGTIDSRTISYGDGSPAEAINGTASHVYAANGTFVATLTVTAGGSSYTRTQTIVVQPNYTMSTDTYNWVDTAGLTSLTLGDDSVSPAISLPSSFRLYGTNYSTLYIGSNGLITFGGNVGANSYSNGSIPSSGTPNAAIYPYWDDLNPSTGGTVKYGNTASGFVVSYEGIAPFSDSASPLTFQVVLTSSGIIRIQYQEVNASSTYGGGRSATVGIEDATGSIGRQYSYLGSPLLANGSAIKFVPAGLQGPTAPSGLTATAASGNLINLSWTDNAVDESGYEIESSSNGSTYSLLVTLGVNSSNYGDATLSPGSTRYYRVRAVNGNGASGYTNTASATTPAPPNAPSGISAVGVSNSQINVSWSDASGNETGFEVASSADNINFTTLATVGTNVTSFADTGLGAMATRYYKVRAVNSAGSSNYTSTASSTTLPNPPAAPSSLVATASSSSQVSLSWTDNSSDETGFKVEQMNSSGQFVAVATTGANVTSFNVSGLNSSTSYTFRVQAYNSGGSNASNTSSATTSAPLAPPSAPTLSGSASSGPSVNLSWTQSAGATSYTIQRLESKTWRTIATGVTGTTYIDGSVRSRTQYGYRVAAINSGGSSPYSNAITVTTPR